MAYMIDLRRLHVLRAVDHYGSVTAAADALHFTPSAASQQVRALGRELGVTLLEPAGRKVRLTPAAHSLLAHADAIHERWAQVEVELRGEAGEPTGLLRVSAFPTAVSALLAPAGAQLRERYPRLQVRLREDDQRSALDALFEGEIELGVIEMTPANPPLGGDRFDQRPLLDDPFDLVVPTGHRLAGAGRIDLADTAAEDWILPPERVPCRQQTIAACTTAGFTPTVAHEAVEWNAIGALIAHGLGIALVPRMVHIPPHLPLVRVCCAGNPSRKLLTVTRSGTRGHPAVAAGIECLEALAPTAVPHPSRPGAAV